MSESNQPQAALHAEIMAEFGCAPDIGSIQPGALARLPLLDQQEAEVFGLLLQSKEAGLYGLMLPAVPHLNLWIWTAAPAQSLTPADWDRLGIDLHATASALMNEGAAMPSWWSSVLLSCRRPDSGELLWAKSTQTNGGE